MQSTLPTTVGPIIYTTVSLGQSGVGDSSHAHKTNLSPIIYSSEHSSDKCALLLAS